MTHKNNAPICVVGVGTAALCTLDTIRNENLRQLFCVAIDTYAAAMSSIETSSVTKKIIIGSGLGAGGDPALGAAAAQRSADHIRAALQGSSRIFLISGFGGGTGTGALPVIANIACDCAPFVQCIVTMPFTLEGQQRRDTAERGLAHLQNMMDNVMVIEADSLIPLIQSSLTQPKPDDLFEFLRRATAWKTLTQLY